MYLRQDLTTPDAVSVCSGLLVKVERYISSSVISLLRPFATILLILVSIFLTEACLCRQHVRALKFDYQTWQDPFRNCPNSAKSPIVEVLKIEKIKQLVLQKVNR